MQIMRCLIFRSLIVQFCCKGTTFFLLKQVFASFFYLITIFDCYLQGIFKVKKYSKIDENKLKIP